MNVKTSFCGEKEAYLQYLRGEREWLDTLYIDPDTTHFFGRESEFYLWIERYLNFMEECLFNKKWTYTLIGPSKGNLVPSGIAVKEGDIAKMYLRSDQLGFSVPKGAKRDEAWGDKYPYGKYIRKTNDFEFVADVMWDSRSQGGSFIWPVVKCETVRGIAWRSQYNVSRGVRSYIEDRADVTLWEIKMFYEYLKQYSGNCENYAGLIMEQMCKAHYELFAGSDRYLIFEWLSHFETFEKYAKFFSFDGTFLYPGTEDIVNIVDGNVITEDYVADIMACKDNHMEMITDACELKKMLGRLQKQINQRTAKMIDRVYFKADIVDSIMK